MKIDKDKVVAFHYSLKDEDGTELEHTSGDGDEPMVYLHGHGNILEGLESQLKDKQAGDQISVTLPPERAYGLRTGNAMQRVPIKHLMTKAKRYRPGMVVKVNSGNGPKDVVIVKVGKFNVDVDTNHPLAGKTLTFDIHVNEVRDANPEELSHGHSHGAHGHSHH